MSTDQLPTSKFDPRKFADKGTRLVGQLPLSTCERLSEYLVDNDGMVQVSLELTLDEEKRRIVTGTAQATLKVICQRCLEPMTIDVHADYALAIVHDEEEALHIPDRCDPFMVANDEEVSTAELIEDELIVSMPLVSYHDEKDCKGKSHYSSGDVIEEKPNPFSILQKLKNGK
jgi:uncharacterized protein